MHGIDPSNLLAILSLILSIKVVISLVCVEFLMRALRRPLIARNTSSSYHHYFHY
jgi:HAMP domain-containing protein